MSDSSVSSAASIVIAFMVAWLFSTMACRAALNALVRHMERAGQMCCIRSITIRWRGRQYLTSVDGVALTRSLHRLRDESVQHAAGMPG